MYELCFQSDGKLMLLPFSVPQAGVLAVLSAPCSSSEVLSLTLDRVRLLLPCLLLLPLCLLPLPCLPACVPTRVEASGSTMLPNAGMLRGMGGRPNPGM